MPDTRLRLAAVVAVAALVPFAWPDGSNTAVGATALLGLTGSRSTHAAQVETGGISGDVRTPADQPLAEGKVEIYDDDGEKVTEVNVGGDGTYSVTGLMPGTYFGRWVPAWDSGYVSAKHRAFPDLPIDRICFGACGVTAGDPIVVEAGAVTDGIDFHPVAGDPIEFEARLQDLSPAVGVNVELFDTAGAWYAVRSTGATGVARFPGLPPGTYYARTAGSSDPVHVSLVNQLYDSIFPARGGVNPTTGTPIPVTQGQTTRVTQTLPTGVWANLDFRSDTNTAVPGNGFFYDTQGRYIDYVSVNGTTRTPAFPPGTYYLRSYNHAGYIDELWDNKPCWPFCDVTGGDPFTVPPVQPAPALTYTWPLGRGSSALGRVLASDTGLPLRNVPVTLSTDTNTTVETAYTDSNGFWRTGRGFPEGDIFAIARPRGYRHQVYNLLDCPYGTCNVAAIGSPLSFGSTVTTLTGIDFSVAPCPAISIESRDGFALTRGEWYTRALTATGGTAPYVFTVEGNLPAGISVDGVGMVSGYVTAREGWANVTIHATDAVGCRGSRRYTFHVDAGELEPPPSITDVQPDHGPAGSQVTITGSSFSDHARVFFDGVEALPVVSRTAMEIIVNAPPPGSRPTAARGRSPVAADATVDITVENDDHQTTTLEDAFTYVTGPLADLLVQRLVVPLGASPGQTIQVTDTTRNSGKGAAPESSTTYYLSTDPVLNRPGHGPADDALTTRAVGPLAPRATSAATLDVTIPPATAPGAYFLIAVADATAVVFEANEANNTRVRPLTLGPDLLVKTLTAPPAALPGAALTVKLATRNGARGPAPASLTRLYWSTDTTWDPGDTLLATQTLAPLAGRSTRPDALPITVPADATKGQVYYLLARADADAAVAELNEDNNGRSKPIRVK